MMSHDDSFDPILFMKSTPEKKHYKKSCPYCVLLESSEAIDFSGLGESDIQELMRHGCMSQDRFTSSSEPDSR